MDIYALSAGLLAIKCRISVSLNAYENVGSDSYFDDAWYLTLFRASAWRVNPEAFIRVE